MKGIFELLDLVVEKIHQDELADHYLQIVQQYKNTDGTGVKFSGLHLYLLGEQHLIRQGTIKRKDKQKFRLSQMESLKISVPGESFQIALLDRSQQEIRLYLKFLANVKHLLLQYPALTPDLPKDELQEFSIPENNPDREELIERAKKLFSSSEKILGKEAVSDCFQQQYELLSHDYRLLESFSQVILLIPSTIRTFEQAEFLVLGTNQLGMIDEGDQLAGRNSTLVEEIEEIHKIEEELKESENLLNKIIESALDAMILLNERGEIDYWSAQSERLTGRLKSDVFGRKFSSELLPEECRQVFENEISSFLNHDSASDGKKRFETKLKINNGRQIDVEISMTSVKLKDRLILSAFIRDISQRKDYEREILDARDKAEEASAAKLTFLSMMSHEIRTPLNAVIGTSQLLLEENPRKDQLENLNILKFSAENLLSIINDILDFNKAEEGKMVLENQPFDLELLCQNIVNSFTPVAKEKGISISFKNKLKRINLVSGDETRLSQVLINLFGNAVKFTSTGSVMLSVELINLNDRVGEVKFEIIDTGIGIPKDKIESIFDRFTQVHEYSKEEKYGGTGLGLPIARNIVKLMGGELKISSIPGLGSTFFFSIKLPIPYKEGLQMKNPNAGEFDIISGKKILIVEDHKINQIVASKFLKKYQCTIDIAENGEEAVKIIKGGDTNYDLILMDLEMPVMNGYEAAVAIREIEKGSDETPIVALSANALPDVSKKVLEAGMNGYISKPFEASHFYAQIADNIKA